MSARQQTWQDGGRQLVEILEAAGDKDRSVLALMIQNRLALPQAYVTMVGETSTGKSSLVNALMFQELLPVSARPTTGVVTHIACRNEAEPRFLAIYRDATQEELDRAEFSRLSLDPGRDILRLQVRALPKLAGNIGLHVFDTPGYNAVLSEHEEVLMTFLPQSDVIVFVVGYRTGFGQIDQDLFEAVAAATSQDKDIPMLLVINRAPPGCGASDKRVAEIRRLAEDGLSRDMRLQIVTSMNLAVAGSPIERRPMEADSLWEEVRKLAFDPIRLETVQRKLEKELIMVLDDADRAAEREEAELIANADERIAINGVLELTLSAMEESRREIDQTIASLETALPHLVERMTQTVKQKVADDVSSSSKWLGHADCAEWISGHCLPFEVRGIGRAVEDHMATEIDALNLRLQEIANTTIAELNKTVTLRDEDPVLRFTRSLASTLGQRLAGNAVNSMLRGLGGVGGAAAGAGNLAKMAVSRAGHLFGKQFGREVYNQIGRIFSKKMLERLSVVVLVLVEAVTFVYEAKVWQGKLIARTSEALDEWQTEVIKDLLEQHLPQIRQANYNIVDDLYGDTNTPEVPEEERDCRLAEIQDLRGQFAKLRQRLVNASTV
jgi:GTPase SAR1 family protein